MNLNVVCSGFFNSVSLSNFSTFVHYAILFFPVRKCGERVR